MAGSVGTLAGLRLWAGVVAPEIPPERLRAVARVFTDLADAIDGGDEPKRGLAYRADQAAASVTRNSAGQGVDSFAAVYDGRLRPLPAAFVADLRVIAVVCEAYARLVDDVRRRFAEVENELLQLVWMVMFQPVTTWLYVVAAARIVKLVRTARLLKALFGANAARIFSAGFPAYALTTLVYATVDGIAYAGGSVGIKAMVNLAHDQPVGSAKENAQDFMRMWAANTGYVLAYDAAKFPSRNLSPTRGGELVARLFGSGFGYTPVYNATGEREEGVATTPEEWAGKLEGHGLRSLIFPPGWLPGR
ncbi:hypothetical protein [Nonomuraea roseola]|uniref:Uncharacterized protein n=1 Tax=Nonomuraea roseola TaxID=46179 RepID=A0ABV5PQH0_9ACTN